MGAPQASVRRFLTAFALFATSLCVSFLGVEMVTRLLYTKPWYDTLIEAQTAGDWRGNLWSNALGLRDRDYVTPKPANVKRILILGDSFTYGSGVADNAATFPELLEQQLNTDLSRFGI